jgi:hypothetical protein
MRKKADGEAPAAQDQRSVSQITAMLLEKAIREALKK